MIEIIVALAGFLGFLVGWYVRGQVERGCGQDEHETAHRVTPYVLPVEVREALRRQAE